MAFAGLWETWQPAKQRPAIESCTIITTEANRLLKPIHERMPVILGVDDYQRWLAPGGGDLETLKQLLAPYDDQKLQAVAIGDYVNNPRHDDAACLEPETKLFD